MASEENQTYSKDSKEFHNSGGSESDQGEDAVVGNLSRFTVLPPGYSGMTKKGHLMFDACFEGGNLGRVDYINEFEYDLFIRPDTCNPRFRVWFNFTVENVKPDQRVIFNIVNFSKTKSLYRDGMSPVVKSTSRNKWFRIPSKQVYYYRCPDHHKNYVMSFIFCFDREDDVYQFSYCYPYSYTRLQNYLDLIEKRKLPYVKRELLGLSVQQRRLDLLTISHPKNLDENKKAGGSGAASSGLEANHDSNNDNDPDDFKDDNEVDSTGDHPGQHSRPSLSQMKKKRLIFITARVHPGESPSSFVCQGFIDFIISNHPIAKTLRDHVIFKVVPMLNPDGVYLGNYRCSLMGFDLNRHWQDPSPWANPTLYACKNVLMDLDKNSEYYLDFYIDIHAHSTLMNGFMYGNVYDDAHRHDRQSVFPKLFHQNAEDFSLTNTNFNKDAVKAGTGRRTLGSCLEQSSHCYTLEVSFYGYQTTTSSNPIAYTEEGYAKLGRNLARTFLDYYKYVEVIPSKPSSAHLNTNDSTEEADK